jgi:hypothetical protein
MARHLRVGRTRLDSAGTSRWDRLCRKLIRQCHRTATEPRLVHKDLRQLFPTMTCAVPDFLANRSLRWVDAMGCKTVKVGGNYFLHHEGLCHQEGSGGSACECRRLCCLATRKHCVSFVDGDAPSGEAFTTLAIVFRTPRNTVCPSTANVCSSSASADGIHNAKAGPNFAGPGPSRAATRPLVGPRPVGLDVREAQLNCLAT